MPQNGTPSTKNGKNMNFGASPLALPKGSLGPLAFVTNWKHFCFFWFCLLFGFVGGGSIFVLFVFLILGEVFSWFWLVGSYVEFLKSKCAL